MEDKENATRVAWATVKFTGQRPVDLDRLAAQAPASESRHGRSWPRYSAGTTR